MSGPKWTKHKDGYKDDAGNRMDKNFWFITEKGDLDPKVATYISQEERDAKWADFPSPEMRCLSLSTLYFGKAHIHKHTAKRLKEQALRLKEAAYHHHHRPGWDVEAVYLEELAYEHAALANRYVERAHAWNRRVQEWEQKEDDDG